jgi:alanyl-tRNA synthetase
MRRLGRSGTTVDGSALFELHDTFGMPVEVSVEEARRTGVPLSPTWQAEYDALMAEQRARSHQARAAVDPSTV